MNTDIHEILSERGKTHGDYAALVADAERGRKALWLLFDNYRYDRRACELLVEVGLLVAVRDPEDNHVVGTEWYSYKETPAARAFADEMQKGESK